MFLGLAYGVALFCILHVATGIFAFIYYKGEMDIYWGNTVGWLCVFAAGGSAIGYIIKGAL